MSVRGHVHKRGKTYTYVVDLTRDPDTGKRRQVTKGGFANEDAAVGALNRVLGRLEEGTYVASPTAPLRLYLVEWLRTIEGDVRPSTLHSYRRNLEQHVIPRIGGVEFGRVDALVLNRLYADLRADGARRDGKPGGLSPRTIQYVSTILHRAFREAVEAKRLATNPADTATPPKPRRSTSRKVTTWKPETLRDFLGRSRESGDRYYPVWVVLATTGARRGEVLGLRWDDVDLDAGQASIVQTVIAVHHRVEFGEPKTESGTRSIALDPGTIAALRAWRARQAEERLALGSGYRDHGLAFAKVDGDPLHPERVSREFDRRVTRWALPHITLHGLRHTWATLALKNGVHPRVVQERLGHSHVSVTLGVYSHVTTGLDQEAADRIASTFLGGS